MAPAQDLDAHSPQSSSLNDNTISNQVHKPDMSNDERRACLSMTPGFHFRPPPPPHQLDSFITDDGKLFQTIHMGRPNLDHSLWHLRIHGLVERSYTLTLSELCTLPRTTITSFHECYGSPLQPSTTNLWRIGNVEWTGIRLRDLLNHAKPLAQAAFVWSDGLDSGCFGGVSADRYQKDLPLAKAMSPEVLVAYEMNGKALSLERGGPVRLVVPGWFGTNSTKWLCSLQLREERSSGPFTTTFYNEWVSGVGGGGGEEEEEGSRSSSGRMRPVWDVEPNSMIVSPRNGDILLTANTTDRTSTLDAKVWGWAWSGDGIEVVEISLDDGLSWRGTTVAPRSQWEWQSFSIVLKLDVGVHRISARATSNSGVKQALQGRRNHIHRISFRVERPPS